MCRVFVRTRRSWVGPTSLVKLAIPPMSVDPDEVTSIAKRFQADFPQVGGKKVVLLSPGGGLLPIRAWPVANFSRVAEELIRLDYAVGIIGLERDQDTAQAIVSHCKSANCIDLTGYTRTVRELVPPTNLAKHDGGAWPRQE